MYHFAYLKYFFFHYRIYNRAASAGQNVATDRAFNNYVVSLVKDFPGESPVDLGDIRDSSVQ